MNINFLPREEGMIVASAQHMRKLNRVIDNYRQKLAALKSENQMLKQNMQGKDQILTQLLHELGSWQFEISDPILNTVFAKGKQKCLQILWDAGYIDISTHRPTLCGDRGSNISLREEH